MPEIRPIGGACVWHGHDMAGSKRWQRQLSPLQLQLTSFVSSLSEQPRSLFDAIRGEMTTVSSRAPARNAAAVAVLK